MPTQLVARSLIAASAVVLAPTAVSAQAYVGTWAASPTQCGIDQSRRNAPLIIKRGRYDQHETHCVFTSLRKSGEASWRMRARCTVEGSRQTHTFTLAVDGPGLTLRDRTGVRKLVRCP